LLSGHKYFKATSNKQNNNKMRVAIIGAGPSGLAAAKVFKADGHIVEVFEKSGRIGGVWTVCYPGKLSVISVA
jgi:cation diffusion facilitator CzcD-associated flavoprotein CzcO